MSTYVLLFQFESLKHLEKQVSSGTVTVGRHVQVSVVVPRCGLEVITLLGCFKDEWAQEIDGH